MIETKHLQRFNTRIYGAYLIRPKVFVDSRGYFFESWNKKSFQEIKVDAEFVQDNCSKSSKHVLRGLHYQVGESAQGKLVGVFSGEVFDVFVDLRKESPTYGQWDGYVLSTHQHDRLWIPPGCAHGFLTLTDTAEFVYKCTNYYDPKNDRSLIWNDPDVGIMWPLGKTIPLLSKKDSEALSFKECEKYEKIN